MISKKAQLVKRWINLVKNGWINYNDKKGWIKNSNKKSIERKDNIKTTTDLLFRIIIYNGLLGGYTMTSRPSSSSGYSDSKRGRIGGVGGLYDDEDESDSVPDVYLSRGALVCAGGVESNVGAGGVE